MITTEPTGATPSPTASPTVRTPAPSTVTKSLSTSGATAQNLIFAVGLFAAVLLL
jgi:hypothetical protein